MCWETRYGILTKRHTASKDMLVKKAFIVCKEYYGLHYKKEIRSFFYNDFVWIQGRLYKSFLGDVKKHTAKPTSYHYTRWILEKGFHSAKNIKVETSLSAFEYKRYLVMSSDRKNHSTKYTIGFFHRNARIKILNCIIPKGSEYYLNECGEYVSDQLIVLPNQ